jgi:hypothetical protein
MKQMVCSIFLGFSFLIGSSSEAQEFFRAQELPVGKSITILPSVPALVTLSTRVVFSSTDTPQTLKFESKTSPGEKEQPIKFTLFDRKAARSQRIVVKPGQVFLYTFQKLESVLVITEAPKRRSVTDKIPSSYLLVQSDRPLTVAR